MLKCDVDSIAHVFGCREISWIHEKENTQSWIKGMIFTCCLEMADHQESRILTYM